MYYVISRRNTEQEVKFAFPIYLVKWNGLYYKSECILLNN